MPEFHALQCFSCGQFQVCQARKDSKFTCKLCGSRQSVRRIHARADAARPVRERVQRLNLARGLAGEDYEERLLENCSDERSSHHELEDADPILNPASQNVRSECRAHHGKSRWDHHVINAAQKLSMSNATDLKAGGAENDRTEIEFITALPDAPDNYRRTSKRRQVPTQPISDPSISFSNSPRLAIDTLYSTSLATTASENDCVDLNSDAQSMKARKKARSSEKREREGHPRALARDVPYEDNITLVVPGGDEFIEDEVCF
jgi:MRN-interacting protein